MNKNRTFLATTRNAIAGLSVLFAEKAARREIFILAASTGLLWVELNTYSLLIFALSWVLLAFEALNTAIEHVCDLYSRDFNPRIKAIKDVAAAAILLTLIGQFTLLLLWVFNP